MKKKLFLIAALIFFSNLIFAQSDYEKVQNFKNQTKKIEQEIKIAASLSGLNSLLKSVDQLRNEFTPEKDLLDKSLYPDNFNSSLEKLTVAIELRKGDFQTIRDLSIQVTYLKDQVDELNTANADLIAQIKTLKSQASKDAKTIKSLQNLTKQLKSSLRQRDELVKTVVDSLLADFIKQPIETDGEIQIKSYKKSEQSNLIYNLQRTVLDNIQFVKGVFAQLLNERYINETLA